MTEVRDYKILRPHRLFKVQDPDNPDDYGLRMAAVEEEPKQFYLHQRSRGGYLRCYDSPFRTADACQAWAQTMYMANGAIVFERKYEDADLPEPRMKREVLEDLVNQFLQTRQITKVPTGMKAPKPPKEGEAAKPVVIPQFKQL